MSGFENLITRLKKWRIYLLFALSVVALSAIFPKEGKFRYEFQKGKPWMHETLVAPFDFPIYKPDELIQAEKDSLLKQFLPYFRLDTALLAKILIQYENEIFPQARDKFLNLMKSRNLTKIPGIWLSNDSLLSIYKERIAGNIVEIYDRGIVNDPVQLENIQRKNQFLKVIQNQLVEDRSAESVFSQKTGYEYLVEEFDKLSSEIQPGVSKNLLFTSMLSPAEMVLPNLILDELTSRRMMENMSTRLSLTEGMIQAGEKIIGIGEPINEDNYRIIQSLKKEYETNPNVQRNYNIIIAGQVLLISLAIIVLYLFMLHFRKEVLQSWVKTFFILMLVVIMSFLASLAIKSNTLNVYVIPFVILPIILKTFYDARIAIFVHLITILMIGFWAPNGFEFVFMNFIAGVVTIFTLRNLYRRGVLFVSAMFALISYSLVFTGISIMQEGRLENIAYLNYAWFAGSALLVLTSYPLIYIFEKIFGFISDATLVELSDTNQPLLRTLAEHAPGTFQHSLQVANLAEEAAIAVGANPLLVRTGALYHDIGKLDEPMYFIENLTSNFNPHDDLEFDESARKIVGHVAKGVELGRKNKLPEIIIDFIRTHHGTSTVQYFYRSYLKKYPKAEVDVAKFSYPGPKPYSQETAILMMADSVEAASRSLKSVNKEYIRELVENIIDHQFRENQFENVDLTMRDISTIKGLFRKRLLNIYHARIEYPK